MGYWWEGSASLTCHQHSSHVMVQYNQVKGITFRGIHICICVYFKTLGLFKFKNILLQDNTYLFEVILLCTPCVTITAKFYILKFVNFYNCLMF